VAISGGSSGGGLFNAEGELVGITTFYLKDAQSLNFALPVEWIGEVAGRKFRGRPRGEAPVAPEPGARLQEDWGDRARALEKAQNWPGMLAHSRRWTKAEPGNELAWFSLALAYSEMGRYREAIEAYREALRLKPDDASTWYNLGLNYSKLGRYREEIEAHREALRLKPDFAKAWFNLGGAYGALGRYREAIAACQEALRLMPDDANAWALLAIAYAQSDNRSAALEAVKELRRYDPQKAEELFNLIMKP
jgi:tetratricopeptide (TPR) repeat protein